MSSNKAALAAIRRDLLKTIPAQVQAEVEKALDKSAHEFADNAQALAPRQDGDLADSVRVEPGADNLSRTVVAGDQDAPQATFIEFGTPNADADPFYWPAFRLLEKRRSGQINRAVNKALKKWGGG
ncbi:HK97-gp10 family putative phage morphogenesis protein [Hansschlegelia zhihuaiae]|uniref:HK97-gp10 family putative phage morphogenesis protein n=1 Tax=Hansschlegelia zhihuaiae TaxID=405005 RepID=UPI0013E8DC5F|nr:HK97-gp10 family putative phage morphogenesis protein [Hansschlegelia zhihuaiae]